MASEGNPYEMFESMRIYIERFGRPYNYLGSVKKLNDEREEVLIEEERKTKEEQAVKDADQEKKIAEQKLALELCINIF